MTKTFRERVEKYQKNPDEEETQNLGEAREREDWQPERPTCSKVSPLTASLCTRGRRIVRYEVTYLTLSIILVLNIVCFISRVRKRI